MPFSSNFHGPIEKEIIMKAKSFPVKFFFWIRRVQIKQSQAGLLKICFRQNDKTTVSKDYQFPPNSSEVIINEKLELAITADQQNETYKTKPGAIQLMFRLADGSTDYSGAEIELTEFIGSQTLSKSVLLRGNIHSAQIDFQCNATVTTAPLNQFKSLANIQPNAQITSKADLGGPAGKSTKQLGLHVRKKERTMLLIRQPGDENAVPTKSTANIEAPVEVKRNPKKCYTNVQLSDARQEFHYGGDQREERVGCAAPSIKLIHQEKSCKSIANPKSSTSLEGNIDLPKTEDNSKQIRKLNDQIKQFEKLNKKLEDDNKKQSREIRQLQEKVRQFENAEQTSEDSQKKILRRLYEDIDNKNKQIKQLENEIDKYKRSIQQQEQTVIAVRRQLKEAKMEKDRVILDSKLKCSNVSSNQDRKSLQRQIDELKKQYEERIKQLKAQNNRLMQCSQESKIDQSDICLSQKCENQKKELRSKVKQAQKALEIKEAQLETKQRLIKNYEDIKKDRQNDNAGLDLSRQMQKWRCQRMLLEQQIQELKSSKTDRNRGGQEEILSLKVEKQSIARQMERLKRNLNQATKEKEIFQCSSNKLQEQLIRTKQKVVDMLNGIQEYGGLELYDTISNLIE